MGERGINIVGFTGNVTSDIQFGETGSGEPACSFVLIQEDKGERTTRVRVNCYGGLVRVCKMRLKKGAHVDVSGELMNRGPDLTELRAKDLAFH